jgi:hypothetical protein
MAVEDGRGVMILCEKHKTGSELALLSVDTPGVICKICDLIAQLTTLKAQLAERDEEIKVLSSKPCHCAYCLERIVEKTCEETMNQIAAHILVCKKHPLHVLAQEVERLYTANTALTKRNGELVEGLKKLEWASQIKKAGTWHKCCPSCQGYEESCQPCDVKKGHHSTCWLNELIQGGKGEE